MKIVIEVIPHDKQRYDTVGDWWVDAFGTYQIRVSRELGDMSYAFLVGLHELVEMALCQHAGITDAAVDEFDLAHPYADSPGDLPDCPYRVQHEFATSIERLVAHAMQVDWLEYDQAVTSFVE